MVQRPERATVIRLSSVLQRFSSRFEQGHLIGLISNPAQGKATIMRLVANEIIPRNLSDLGKDDSDLENKDSMVRGGPLFCL